MSGAEITHDTFISYSRADAAQVDVLAAALAERGLRVWLDKARLQPGYAWRDEIENDMNACAGVLVVWGPHGLGGVQRQERGLAYAIRDARPEFRLLYVVLPGSPPPQASFANVDTYVRFRTTLDEPDVLEALVRAIKGEPPKDLAVELPDEPAPYRGLAAFGVGDAGFFFGRTKSIEEMKERLAHHPFLAVLGASGSGKTSLVQAGFVAGLRSNPFPHASEWPVVLVRPGPHPLRALAGELAGLADEAERPAAAEKLATRLGDGGDGLPAILRDLPQRLRPQETRLVLVVDRLEELFTLCDREDEARAFAGALLAAARDPHELAWVIVTMRADFYAHLARRPDLAAEVVHHQLFLTAMKRKETLSGGEEVDPVEEIVAGPAAVVGAIFERHLARQVQDDAEVRGEVALPLLQHALDLLWRKRRGRYLTWDAYEAIGGVAGALRYHADRVIEAMSPQERGVARRIFARLIWIEEGSGAIAGRRVDKSILLQPAAESAANQRVLQRLADERLVVMRGEGEQATAELAHDTLPLEWEQLRSWVREDREFLLWRLGLQAYVRDKTLLRDSLLVVAERWKAARTDDLTADETDLIDRSVELRRREQRNRLRARIGLALGVAAVLALPVTVVVYRARVDRQARLALSGRAATAALSQLSIDPELGVLLGREAVSTAYTPQAESALRRALLASHLRAVLRGHEEAVRSAGFGPGGTRVVSGGWDKTVRVWGVADGHELAKQTYQGMVETATFSPDGKRVLVGCSDGSVHLWTIDPQSDLALERHGGPVKAAAFSRDGRRVVTASGDGTARIWDVEDARLVRTLDGRDGPLRSVAFRPDGRRVVIGADNGTVRLSDVEGDWTFVPAGHQKGKRISAVAYSADGARILTASWDGTARLWDDATGAEIARYEHAGPVFAAAFAPAGDRVVTAGADESARLWSGRSGRPSAILIGHQGAVNDARFAPDGRLVVTAGDDHTARLWEADTGEPVATLRGHAGPLRHASFSPDGRFLLTDGDDETVRVWEVGADSGVRRLGRHTTAVRYATFSPDGRWVATVAQDEVARVWDVTTGEVRELAGHDGWVFGAAFGPDGRRFATASEDHTVRLWEVNGWQEGPTLRGYDTPVYGVAFSPNGAIVATAGGDGSVRLWDAATGNPLNPILRGHVGAVYRAVFSRPDGRRIVSAGADGTARIWDASSGKEEVVLRGHATGAGAAGQEKDGENVGEVYDATFSPDGTLVATAGADQTARVWEVDTGREVTRFTEHGGPVNGVAFSGDGRYVLSASSDGTARVWDARDASGGSLAQLLGHAGPVYSAAFSPNGQLVVTASGDGSVRLFQRETFAPLAELLEAAGGRVTRQLTAEERERYLR